MADGSSLAVVQAALIIELGDRDGLEGVPLGDAGPVSAEDLQNEDGTYEAMWLGGANVVDLQIPFTGVPITYDEVYDQDLVIQVLKIGEDADTQSAATARSVALLGEVVGTVAADPSLGITPTAAMPIVEVVIDRWEHTGGWLGSGDQYGSRFVVKVRVSARIAIS